MAKKKRLANYTTKIDATKSVGQIQGLLAIAGAQAVMIEYGPDAVPAALSFRLQSDRLPGGEMSFRMPANIEGCLAALKEDNVEARYATLEHAQRVGWRILLHWLENQLAYIRAGMATTEELFLPYAQVGPNGETFADILETNPQRLLGNNN